MSEITPVPSNSNMSRTSSARVFGGKFADLTSNVLVQHNLHNHAVVMNVMSAYSNVRILELSVFPVLLPAARDFNVNLYVGWGHCEHTAPENVAQLAQLPCFKVYSSSDQGFGGEPLVCEFDMSIVDQLKPIPLEGGRPKLFAVAITSSKERISVAELFFRVKVQVDGYDIVFA
ncbi:ORF2 [Grapevine associated tymo-like virus]|uniref:ORF2 n=1 Tax=Grapevine associated tymo-like virus TaxID=2338396 RepID=UPI000EB6F46A|nr:ORF2 [Grapevine associated tymo-like virus]WPR22336.1 ORF2 [Grapevine-associated tymo-like virus]AYA22296.1 ORF2 [Grapevine associated tymo-like virus]UTH80060.1 capsid protein [Grapevine associated tymo-like virus]UTH80062.1 capsid protein [Grapevine associated tymo-like virus]UTH80064.1 capsid protein [Grapevine associated tymo-like virus]